ncbi:hypothetical protein BDZ97DRAFT_1955762 [Flammula alnicola]|nr:hypothetical protein BDZ97DRAFT_1955762 [Flammula alnicola]
MHATTEIVVLCLVLIVSIVTELTKRLLRRVLPAICRWAGVPLDRNVTVTGGQFVSVVGNMYIDSISQSRPLESILEQEGDLTITGGTFLDVAGGVYIGRGERTFSDPEASFQGLAKGAFAMSDFPIQFCDIGIFNTNTAPLHSIETCEALPQTFKTLISRSQVNEIIQSIMDSRRPSPGPEPETVPSGTMGGTQLRSVESMLRKQQNFDHKRLQKIKITLSLRQLEKNLSPSEVQELERICTEDLGPKKAAQCMSAQFVDKHNKPILFYFGSRVLTNTPPLKIQQSEQYKGRTKEDLKALEKKGATVLADGLSPQKCERYQLACQSLCADVPLHSRFDNTRHEGTNIMKYKTDDDMEIDSGSDMPDDSNEEEVNPKAYDLMDTQNSGLEKGEQAGVVHLVHGWIQQGQPLKGLFISGDISHTSTSMAGSGSYYYLTQSIAVSLSEMFKVAFPEWHAKYRKAFEAGVWMSCDPGPYLGRAIIYKLQGHLHRDRHDLGPSASFGVGNYTGGEMLFPQFNAKFS